MPTAVSGGERDRLHGIGIGEVGLGKASWVKVEQAASHLISSLVMELRELLSLNINAMFGDTSERRRAEKNKQ